MVHNYPDRRRLRVRGQRYPQQPLPAGSRQPAACFIAACSRQHIVTCTLLQAPRITSQKPRNKEQQLAADLRRPQPRKMANASDMCGEWKKRSVVSAFIMNYNDGKPRVALFQRSGKVLTYGYVEKKKI